MILIGYDGSEDPKAAIERCGAIFAGQPAIVLNSLGTLQGGSGPYSHCDRAPAGVADADEIDAASQRVPSARPKKAPNEPATPASTQRPAIVLKQAVSRRRSWQRHARSTQVRSFSGPGVAVEFARCSSGASPTQWFSTPTGQ